MLSERIDEFEQFRPTQKYLSLHLGRVFRVTLWEISISQKKELHKELKKANEVLKFIRDFNDTNADDWVWEGSRDRCEDLLTSGNIYLRTKMIRGHIGKSSSGLLKLHLQANFLSF